MIPITKDGKTLLGYADEKQLAKLGLVDGASPKKGSKLAILDPVKAAKQEAAEKEAAAKAEAKKTAENAGAGAKPAAVKKGPAS